MKRTTESRKPIRILSSLLFSLAVLVGIGLTASVTTTVAHAQEEFKYGAVMPVTGPIPQYGEFFIRGSQLALSDLEQNGWINGKKIRIILEDGKNDPKLSLAGMNKLVNIDKVSIVESVGSSVVLAIGPVAQENGVVLVNTAAQNPNIRKLGNYIFSMGPLADGVIGTTADYALHTMKAKTVALLYVNNEYGRGVAMFFKKLYEKGGGKIVATEIYALGETDYSTHLTKLKFANADIIFFVGHENELGYALKKAKQIGLKTPWLSSPGVFNPVTLEIAGAAAEGIQAAGYPFDPVNGTDKMKAFGKQYEKRFGVMPAYAAARTYDSIMIYAAALKNGARTAAEIRDSYAKVKDYDGVEGPVTIDKDGISLEKPVIVTVKDGKIVHKK